MTLAINEPGAQVALADKIEYAKAMAASGLIPRVYQTQPANVLVAIEYGEALGLRPIVAMSEINVINGTPSLSASLMASLAREAGHKVRVESSANPPRATCTIIRADDPTFEHVVTWDEQRARDNGLWGKGHWAKDPEVMLQWRAISACVRRACPEVLAGIKYTPEEVQEFTGPSTTATQVQPRLQTQPESLSDVIASDPTEDAESIDWAGLAEAIDDLDRVYEIYREAARNGAPRHVLESIADRGRALRTKQSVEEAELVDEATGEVQEPLA